MDNVNAITRSSDSSRFGSSVGDGPRLSPLQTIWSRRWIVGGVILVCMVIAAILAQFLPKVYTRTCQIVVEPASMKTMSDGVINMEAFLNTQAELITKSAAIQADAINSLTDNGTAQLHDFANPVDRLLLLRTYLTATPGKNDNTITVAYSSHYPDEAARVVTAVVDAYAGLMSADSHKAAGDSLRAVEADKEKWEREMSEKRVKLAQLKGEIGNLQSGEALTAGDKARLKALSEALSVAQIESINDQTDYEQFVKQNMSDPSKLDRLLATGQLNGLAVTAAHDGEQMKADRYLSIQRLNDLKERYLPNHPAVQAAQARVDDLTASMVLYLHEKWVSSSAKVKRLQADCEQLEKDLNTKTAQATKSLADKTTDYAAAEQDLARTEKLTDMLVTRMQEITENDRRGNVRITVMAKPDPSEPVRPTRPNLWLMLFEGLMVGLILGTCVALVDPRIRSAEEVVAATTLPIVGVVPHMRRSLSLQTRGRKVHLDPMSDVSEAFRSIRSAIFFGPKGKTVLITSPMRGEGKSTTAANLSIAMAEAGQRVLLVDGDLREPMQHKIFGINNDSGVASVIAGRGSVDRAIHTTGVRGLDLLPCGPIPYNPSETINNQAFADLLVELSRRYDYVIVDSPPVLAVTDARILAAMCELAVLVVRAEKSHKRATQDARDGLLGFGATIVGVVINDGPRNQHRYGYYGGYGHQETQPVPNFVRHNTTTVERKDSVADDLAMTKR